MHTILSWGMGLESTAILVRWLLEPETRPCALEELLVLTAQTGDEYDDTRVLCERYILPLLRAQQIPTLKLHGAAISKQDHAGDSHGGGIWLGSDSYSASEPPGRDRKHRDRNVLPAD